MLNSSPIEPSTNKFKPTQNELLTLSTRPYGSSGKPPENSNNLRNILIGLVLATASLGGVNILNMYSFDQNCTIALIETYF